MGHLKEPSLCTMGARKGTLHVPKQLTLKQCFRNGSTVKRHERTFAAATVRMNDARHDLLTGTSLPKEQDRRI